MGNTLQAGDGARRALSGRLTLRARINALEARLALYERGIPVPAEDAPAPWFAGFSPQRRAQVDRVLAVVAAQFHIQVSELLGTSREFPTTARFTAVWMVKEVLPMSYERVARIFGGRDRSTVIRSIRRAQGWRAGDPDYLFVTDRIVAELRAEFGLMRS